MGKIVFSFFLLIYGSMAYSQEGNYLYIDASNGQLFYIKLKDKIYSSSLGGYVIITGINESTPDLNIGFPGNIFPEQRFSVPVNKNDQGFHLKRTDENGWELLNLKTLAVIKNSNPPKAADDPSRVKKTDAFSLMLSRVVNDSSVLFADSKLKVPATGTTSIPEPVVIVPAVKDTIQKETVVAPPVKEAVKKDSSIAVKEIPATPPVKETVRMDSAIVVKETPVDTVQKEKSIMSITVSQEHVQADDPEIITIPAPVRKLFDQHFDTVYEATYVAKNNGKYDTIRLSYPVNSAPAVQKPVVSEPVKATTPAPSEDTLKKADVIEPVAVEINKKPDTAAIIGNKIIDTAVLSATPASTPTVICKLIANDQDVDNLRVKLLEVKNTDEKIAICRLYFTSKCYSVKQIKALSELFGGDEDKYRFFDTAHPYISDNTTFPTLISELKEDYYRNRFKVIIRK